MAPTRTGDLLDELEAAGVEGCRRIVNNARQNSGLPTLERERADRELSARLTAPTSRDMYGRVEHRCAERGCTLIEPDERLGPGAVKWTKIKGPWYCQRHRAGHEDEMRPYTGPRLAYGPGGAIVDLDERAAEAERQRATAASRRRQREAREAERAEDARALARYEAGAADRFRREHI